MSWPPLPGALLALWDDLAGYAPPQACLINFYGAGAKMGLHQDRDEADFAAPVVSLSLPACSASAEPGAPTPRARSGSVRAMRWFSAAQRGWRSTASTASNPAHRPCSPRGDGSI
jgi:hypothetical protein